MDAIAPRERRLEVTRLGRLSMLPAGFAFLLLAGPAAAETLSDIVARGEIVVGSKADYQPYGFRDKDGRIVGIEPDLAADVAARLGVRLRLEPVTPANRIQMLEDGKVDLLIATMSITEERSKAVSFVSPAYYASGIAGLALSGSGIRSEADLKGKTVCAVKGNVANEELQTVYVQKELETFDTIPEAAQALRERRCATFVYDHAALRQMKKSAPAAWRDYDLIEFTAIDPLPWGIAVKWEDRPGPLTRILSKIVLDWHTSGRLAQLEQKWLGKNSRWVAGIREKYRRQP